MLRPHGLTLLGTVAPLVAGGAAAIALSFQQVGFVGWSSTALLLGVAAGWAYRRPPSLIWALRVGSDDSYGEVLLSSGWVQARRLGSVRGPGWVSLRFGFFGETAVFKGNVTVTLWRCCLPAVYWRRLCVLAAQPPADLVAMARRVHD
jgi:hypothetical protein